MSENKKTVLMIEDDSFLRKLYKDKFVSEGINFLEALNGIEGMNKMKSEKPDLVILDILLPMKSGFDLLEEKKEDEEIKDIPVIILSNLGQDTDIEEGKTLGAKEYFVKSEVSFSELVEKVKSFF